VAVELDCITKIVTLDVLHRIPFEPFYHGFSPKEAHGVNH
jgi:hypothetical protein